MNKLEKDLTELFAKGSDKVHVLADFDGTLTKVYINGQKAPSLIAPLRQDPRYLPPEYSEAAHALFEEYHPFERAHDLNFEFRKVKMQEWWTKHENLLVQFGLKIEHLKHLAKSEHLKLRDQAAEFLTLMAKLNIPVVILSAAGIGELIPLYFKEQNVDYSNIHYIINKLFWDSNGQAIGFHQPVIHTLNKDETLIEDSPEIFQAVKDRVNVLLLGNNIGDLGMSKGFDLEKEVTIGFLDPEESDHLPEFEKAFDHVIIGKDYTEINSILSSILT